ncbi:unnamed protein product, partial [Iphiclides podalirius]
MGWLVCGITSGRHRIFKGYGTASKALTERKCTSCPESCRQSLPEVAVLSRTSLGCLTSRRMIIHRGVHFLTSVIV